jgi:hypothetical protein
MDQRFFAALGKREQTFAQGDTQRFARTTGLVPRPTDMTKQKCLPALMGRIFRMQAIRTQDSSEQPARKLLAEIRPQR